MSQVLLSALAEAMARKATGLLEASLTWSQMVAEGAGSMQLLCFIWHCKHDETPLRTRVRYAGDFGNADGSDVQTAKVHVVQGTWSIIVRTKEAVGDTAAGTFYLTTSGLTVQCRASQRANAESLAKVLESCVPVADVDRIARMFPFAIRAVTCDANSANLRTQRLLKLQGWRGWAPLSLECQAHKIHAAVARVFALAPDVVSGMKHLNQYMIGSGILVKTRRCLRQLVEEGLTVMLKNEQAEIVMEASTHYKQVVMELFKPSGKKAATAVQALMELLNGDSTLSTSSKMRNRCAQLPLLKNKVFYSFICLMYCFWAT